MVSEMLTKMKKIATSMVKIISLSDIALKYKLKLNLQQYHPKEILVFNFSNYQTSSN